MQAPSASVIRAALDTSGERWLSVGILVLRIYVGTVVFVVHGIPKMRDMMSGGGHFAELVSGLGLPAPMLFAWFGTLVQIAGTVLIVAGLLTRLSALALLSVLVIGVLGVHWGDPFSVMEAGLAYWVMLTVIVLVGPGRYSIDHWILSRASAR